MFAYYIEKYLKGRDDLKRCQVQHGANYESATKTMDAAAKNIDLLIHSLEKRIAQLEDKLEELE